MTLQERSARGPSFDWPTLQGLSPIWTGRGFLVGGEARAVLDYDAGESGWSEELTRFHEEAAGEGTHPIDVASRRRARAALRRHVLADHRQAVLLEIGCSSGFLLRELMSDWPEGLVIGSDYINGPLRRLATRMPDLPLLRFDLIKCPLPSASVDAAVLLNVLEHIEDDEAALRQVARILKPGGVAVVEVPAGPRLYDAYDKYLRHHRRYDLREVSQLLERAGLTVVTASHLGCVLYPAFVLVKRRNQRWLDAPEHVQRALVERNIRRSGQGPLLKLATAIEEWLARWVSFPVGIRCVAVALKQPAYRGSGKGR
jgi:SAM-dependent methyltransferase